MARGGRRGRRRQTTPNSVLEIAEEIQNTHQDEAEERPEESEEITGEDIQVIIEEQPRETERNSSGQVEQRRSYVSILDPNAGTPLKFVPPVEIEGTKYAKIEKEDIESEVNYWSSAVLCTVVGANPPLSVIEGFIRRVWRNHSIDKILPVKKGIYLVRFEQEAAKWEVIQNGVVFFDNKPMVVKEWNEDLDINIEELQTIPIWIQLPQLDLKYWGPDSLSKIGSMVGVPIKTDKITMQKQRVNYARLMVEVPLRGPFPTVVEFVSDKGVIERQNIVYEWKPVKCSSCSMYGHEGDVCRRKEGLRQEWRPIQRPEQPVPNQILPRTTTDDQGFTEVQRRMAARKQGGEKRNEGSNMVHNSYSALDLVQNGHDPDRRLEESPPDE